MPKPIVNVADLELQPRPAQFKATGPAAQRFDARMAPVARQLGAKKLGYSVTAIPPGKRAFPYHCHHGQEEMFYVIAGSGEVRIGGERHPIRAGDIIACPPGGRETAHQIVNTGKEELKYLGVSTMEWPEVCEYPDSGKVGVLGDDLRHLYREEREPGYWDGE